MENEKLGLGPALGFADAVDWNFDPREEKWEWCDLAKGLFGLAPLTDMTYAKFLQALHPEDRERVHDSVTDVLQGKLGTLSLEFRTIGTEDGVLRTVAAKGQVIYGTHGPKVAGIFQDLTTQRNAERETRVRSEFFANMSHEMRTPLSAMLGFADLAMDPAISPENRFDFLRTIRRNGDQLLRLINEVLDLSKIEANAISVDESRFSLASALKEVAETFRQTATEKMLDFVTVSQGKVPEFIETDRFRFKQVLLNVVGNAMKFTERGFVQISVKLAQPPQVGTKMKIEISVADSGIGIGPRDRARLFHRFCQGNSSISQRFGGTGLGLALSRQIARALGGDLVLRESHPGRGSTFVFTLENSAFTPETSMISLNKTEHLDPRAPVDIVLDGVRVLLVEDAPDNQVLISLYLKAAGARVDIAENGAQAVQSVKDRSYDVVLMDLNMPVLDGYSATQKLRGQGYSKPIIALTAHAMTSERERCLRTGFNDHLSKPVNRRALLKEVAQFANIK